MSGILNLLLGGGTNFALDTQAISASDFAVSPADATALVTIAGDTGVVTVTEGTDFTMVLHGDANDLEIFVATTSGTVDTGTVDAWIALVGAGWSKTRSGVGTSTFSGTYTIRIAATGAVISSAQTFSLSATVSI